MQTHSQEGLLQTEAEQRVSKRARLALRRPFGILSSILPCDLSTIKMVVTGRTSEGAKVLLPLAIHICAVTPLNGPISLLSLAVSRSGYNLSPHSRNMSLGLRTNFPLNTSFSSSIYMTKGYVFKTSASLLPSLDMEHSVYRAPMQTIPTYKCPAVACTFVCQHSGQTTTGSDSPVGRQALVCLQNRVLGPR
jgi:hypothetical protein